MSTAVVFTWNPRDHRSFSRKSRQTRKKKSSQSRYRAFRSQDNNYYLAIQLTPDEAKQLLKYDPPHGSLSDVKYEPLHTAFDSAAKFYDFRPTELTRVVDYTVFPISLYHSLECVGTSRVNGKTKLM